MDRTNVDDLKRLVRAGLAKVPAHRVVKGGKLVNVMTGEIYPADVAIYEDTIVGVGDVADYIGPETELIDAAGKYLTPGLIDGHIHSECSLLSITSYAKGVVPRGTTSMVSGLDEYLVVSGLEGLREVLDEVKASPLKVFWGASFKTPYSIPASTVAFNVTKENHAEVQKWPECFGVWETLPEFVENEDEDVLGALALAAENRLPIFGCAPIMRGTRLNGYLCCGARMDHESYDHQEALEKMRKGMHMVIRESSVTHFLAENVRVVTEVNPALARRVSYCIDDITATDLVTKGHVDHVVRLAIAAGVDPVTAIQMGTINTAEAYRIDHLVGSITPGRIADILLIDDPAAFNVQAVIANGKLVARDSRLTYNLQPPARSAVLQSGRLQCPLTTRADFEYKVAIAKGEAKVLAMRSEGPFIRRRRDVVLKVENGVVQPDTENDVAMVSVLERFGRNGNRALAFCSGWTLKKGAMASSASPDDNNIVVMGADAGDMSLAVNHLIENGGGQVVVAGGEVLAYLALPVGGIVSDLEPEEVARQEAGLVAAAWQLGCTMENPLMNMFFFPITGVEDYAINDVGPIDCNTQKVFDPILSLSE